MVGVKRLLARSVAVALAAVPLLPAAPAWAPKYILGSAAYGDCLRPAATEVERFEGLYEPTSFSRSGSSLLVTGLLNGVCTTDAGVVTAVLPETVATFPVTSVDAFCAYPDIGVHVRPGVQVSGADPKTGQAAPFLVDLSRGTVIERSWTDGDPAALRGRLCALDRLAGLAPLPALAAYLDGLVRA